MGRGFVYFSLIAADCFASLLENTRIPFRIGLVLLKARRKHKRSHNQMIRSHPVGICVVLLPGCLNKNGEHCTDLCEAAIVHMSLEFPVILGGAR